MIELRELSLRRGRTVLLNECELRINTGEHCALVGANGAGKSSLFKLILGELSLDSGELSIPSNWRVAHMAQEVEASPRSAVDYVMDGHREFRQLEEELANCKTDGELARIHGDLDTLQAYRIPSTAEKLLLGLGFKVEQLQNPVSDFSGGWRIRLNLAQALMQPSELLLLDEPTNHLDLDACLWLEQWLKQYPGTLVLVSHDRDFIDTSCDTVIHIENKTLHRYRGNYSAFENQRAERLAQQQQQFEKQQIEIAHMEDFVRRFRAKASKAKQAQSRIKALDRMALIAPAHVDSPFKFKFYQPGRISDPVINLKQADLGYSTPVLNKVMLSIHPSTRLGLLGANGQGKSTLIKTLAGEIALLNGERVCGEHCDIGYFSQHQLESLDIDASPVVQLQRARPDAREQEIRTFLGGFNFRGEAVDNGIAHFSGGEKARLALALIVWQKPSLLLLDEPTNHLDLEMCHALTVALQDFEGAVVLISHDRHLLRNTVDQFVLVDAGKVTPYEGDLEDYRQYLQGEDSESKEKKGTPEERKKARQEAANLRKQQAPIRKRIQEIEKAVSKLEKKLKTIEDKLADTDLYEAERKAELQKLLLEQSETRKENDTLEEEWLELADQLEA